MKYNDDETSLLSNIQRRQRRQKVKKNRQWEVTANEPEWDQGAGPRVSYLPTQSSSIESNDSRLLMRDDAANIALLIFLYLLQGIPLGLTASIPMILQNYHITYHQQAFFSFASWPFSIKLFWAPIVDAIFWKRIGRRKSWLVPAQFLIGIFMFVFSYYVTSIMGEPGSTEPPNILYLTGLFFQLNFLAATQDIALDGWALTMLKSHNVGYASTCNAVGQTAGYFLGNAIFLSLESAEFSNRFLRSEPLPYGVVTLSDFVFIWGIIFIVSTTLVFLFKREEAYRDLDLTDAENDEFENMSIIDAYKLLWKIIRLPAVIRFCAVLLTAKIAFAAADGITGLKLVEMGVPKDKLALIAIPLTPVQIALPWILGKYIAGPKPMQLFQNAYPYKLVTCLTTALLVYVTPSFMEAKNQFPFHYYMLCIFAYCIHQIASTSLFVAYMAFFAKISDPAVGGTYMTLLNTVSNLGGNWPVTSVLSIVDDMTYMNCVHNQTNQVFEPLKICKDNQDCGDLGICMTSIDGYFILIGLCFIFGLLWWLLVMPTVNKLQSINKTEWSISQITKSKSLLKLSHQN